MVDADPEADPPWIATAHIVGPSLHQFLREHGAPAPPTLRVLAAGLAEGLEAIHNAGLVHRDLKPGNVIFAGDGPRIIDLGIARPLDTTTMTMSGAVLGTVPYMSPEQTEGQQVSPASDVFSLGTVLAFAATGTNPFAASCPVRVWEKGRRCGKWGCASCPVRVREKECRGCSRVVGLRNEGGVGGPARGHRCGCPPVARPTKAATRAVWVAQPAVVDAGARRWRGQRG